MATTTLGVHHITGICSDPQRNIDFYVGVLGLPLVKITVNFDHPTSYQFYYGDEMGRPGTVVGFFVWPDGYRGIQGIGQSATLALSIPPSAVDYWVDRLADHRIQLQGPAPAPCEAFDERVLAFRDPDGLGVELVADREAEGWPAWTSGPVPAEHVIRGLHAAVLWEGGKVTAGSTGPVVRGTGEHSVDRSESPTVKRRRQTPNGSK